MIPETTLLSHLRQKNIPMKRQARISWHHDGMLHGNRPGQRITGTLWILLLSIVMGFGTGSSARAQSAGDYTTILPHLYAVESPVMAEDLNETAITLKSTVITPENLCQTLINHFSGPPLYSVLKPGQHLSFNLPTGYPIENGGISFSWATLPYNTPGIVGWACQATVDGSVSNIAGWIYPVCPLTWDDHTLFYYHNDGKGHCSAPYCPGGTSYSQATNRCVPTTPIVAPPAAKPANQGKTTSPKTPSTDDPINIGTGNNVVSQTDISIAMPLSGLSVTRTYNSAPTSTDASVMRSFGTRWTQLYDVSIRAIAPPPMSSVGSVATCSQWSDTGYQWCDPLPPATGTPQWITLTRGDGKSLDYQNTGNGQWHSLDDPGLLSETVAGDGVTPTGWIYTDSADQHTETFDGHGVLLTLTARGGSTQQLTYSTGVSNDSSAGRYPATAPLCPHVESGAPVASGTLLCVTDAWGRQLQFEHDAAGRITRVIDPAGQATLYAYDGASSGCTDPTDPGQVVVCGANNLTAITYSDGKTKTLFYNEAALINGGTACPGATPVNTGFSYLLHAITGIVDENNARSVSWTYDCAGNATSSQSGDGMNITQVALGAAGVSANSSSTTSTVTSPAGTQTLYGFTTITGLIRNTQITQPASNGSAAATATNSYDSNGNITSHTNFNGMRTTTTYDPDRNLEISRVEAAGTAQARTTSTGWHPQFRLPVQIAAPLRLTTLNYDSMGNLINITEQATSDSTGASGLRVSGSALIGLPRSWVNSYNALGQLLTRTGPRTDVSDVTHYQYDSSGNLISMTNAAGQTTTLGGYDLYGHPGNMTDPNGLVTTYVVSPRGWLVSQTRGTEVTGFSYDGAGQLISVTAPNGSVMTNTYDTAHRLTGITDNTGNRISYTLDTAGNRILEQVSDVSGNLTRQISRTMDALNRLHTVTGTSTSSYTYDASGNLTSVTDPLGNVTSHTYDALDRRISSTDANQGVTRFSYNAQSQLTGVSDPRQLVTTYQIDGLGNLLTLTSPDTGVTRRTVDIAGNLISSQDAKGQITTRHYDVLNRLTQLNYADGQTVTLHYDQGVNGIGRLSRISDSSGTITLTYNQAGYVVEDNRTVNGNSDIIGYGWDAAGQLSSMTYPDHRVLSYTRDALGRISQITSVHNGVTVVLVSKVMYAPSGQVLSYVNGATKTMTPSIDLDGRVTGYSMNAGFGSSTGSGTGASTGAKSGSGLVPSTGVMTRTLHYDAGSRLISQADPISSINYGYDALNRLISSISPGTAGVPGTSYHYDANGNRSGLGVGGSNTSYTYGSTSNQLTRITTTQGSGSISSPILSDANGSMISNGSSNNVASQFGYDARGRLTSAITTLGAVTYQINALGQRVLKRIPGTGTAPATTTVFNYDMNGKLINEHTGTSITDYLYLNDTPIAVVRD